MKSNLASFTMSIVLYGFFECSTNAPSVAAIVAARRQLHMLCFHDHPDSHEDSMYTFSLAEAKTQLSKLIELVEGGEQVTITKRGKAVVKIVRSDPPRQQVPSLTEHRAGIRYLGEPAAEFIRKMRDSDRF